HRRVSQAFFHVTHSRHIDLLHSLDRPVNYFVRTFLRTRPEILRKNVDGGGSYRPSPGIFCGAGVTSGRVVGLSSAARKVVRPDSDCNAPLAQTIGNRPAKCRDEYGRVKNWFHLVWRFLALMLQPARAK